MSFFVWVEIVCDTCAKTTAGRFLSGSRVPRRELSAEALQARWVRSGEEWTCRQCARRAAGAPEAGDGWREGPD